MRRLVLLALLPAACRREPAASVTVVPADAVATVGDAALLKKDLAYAASLAGNLPESTVLATLADEEALAQMARAEGLGDDPSVRAAIRRMLAARLREKHAATAGVSDDEVKAAISAQPASVPPARLRLAFLRRQFANAGSPGDAVQKLKEAAEKWKALPPDASRVAFGPLAVEYSDDNDTRYQGGDAGWISSGERHVLLPPEVTAAAAAASAPGLLPDVLLTKDAAWLVLVSEFKTPAAPAANPEQIRTRLAAARQAAQEAALIEKARAAAPVKILIPLSPAQPPAAKPAAPPANP